MVLFASEKLKLVILKEGIKGATLFSFAFIITSLAWLSLVCEKK